MKVGKQSISSCDASKGVYNIITFCYVDYFDCNFFIIILKKKFFFYHYLN